MNLVWKTKVEVILKKTKTKPNCIIYDSLPIRLCAFTHKALLSVPSYFHLHSTLLLSIINFVSKQFPVPVRSTLLHSDPRCTSGDSFRICYHRLLSSSQVIEISPVHCFIFDFQFPQLVDFPNRPLHKAPIRRETSPILRRFVLTNSRILRTLSTGRRRHSPHFSPNYENNRLVASFPLKMRNTGSWAAAVDDDDDDDDWEKGARSLFTCPRYTVDD